MSNKKLLSKDIDKIIIRLEKVGNDYNISHSQRLQEVIDKLREIKIEGVITEGTTARKEQAAYNEWHDLQDDTLPFTTEEISIV